MVWFLRAARSRSRSSYLTFLGQTCDRIFPTTTFLVSALAIHNVLNATSYFESMMDCEHARTHRRLVFILYLQQSPYCNGDGEGSFVEMLIKVSQEVFN